MEDIKLRFADAIAARLTGAPDSPAKSELVEELTGDLYQRYAELTASGVGTEEAFSMAMDDLGDVDELIAYLRPRTAEKGDRDPLENLLHDVDEITRTACSAAKSALEGIRRMMSAEGIQEPKDIRIDMDVNGRTIHVEQRRSGDDGESREYESSCGISASGLSRVELENSNGDIRVDFSQPEDGDAVITGKLGMLKVESTAAGVLRICREHTAAAESLRRRRLDRTDIYLNLPCRDWDAIHAATANGDAEVDGQINVGSLIVETASGDIRAETGSCGRLKLTSANGDISYRGDCGEASLKSASGDLSFEGRASVLRCGSMSGDISLELSDTPETLEVSTKSGDCSVRLPEGDFCARMRTMGGDVNSAFLVSGVSGGSVLARSGSGGVEYSITTMSGDIDLRKR